MARRKHRRLQQDAELDITAFMNLMIVLVPVLLLSMVFEHTKVLELNFPKSAQVLDQTDLDNEQLQLIIRKQGFDVASSKAGILKHLPVKEGEYDFENLSLFLRDVKSRIPDKSEISILLERDTSYQTLVTAMDTARSYKTVLVASVVDAELFPSISIGDAPPVAQKNSQ
jgi:biopolymer transport protein ExbD